MRNVIEPFLPTLKQTGRARTIVVGEVVNAIPYLIAAARSAGT
jgi:hypothetical protein